ncbi:mitochondrial fission ELM1 family protein [Thalassoglobus polymorphus]|uniref:Nucleoside-diphosphate sugar epimerase n=1 Tax=Thalassoglobus polymorphus TaxID=2527994 RepID=A0A517QGQ2_9PLAN|nr:mitochondrial fission ELM1 family protein [Thalassoglobus polymorphus]QDT30819.1 hypothetical protein Mal48_00460 [Thalassoglobus polymorphus]
MTDTANVNTPSFSSLTCWAIADGAAGHQSQLRGLAEAIGVTSIPFDARVRFPWTLLPSPLVSLKPGTFRSTEKVLQLPAPDLIMSCGRQAALAALSYKKAYNNSAFLIHLQDPQRSRNSFDLIVAPEHDNLQGKNVIQTLGAMHPLSLEKLQEAARIGPVSGLDKLTSRFIAVLLGGPNKYYAFDEKDVQKLTEHLQSAATDDLQLAIIPSRRTPSKATAALSQTFGEDHFVWDGKGENPYLSALALCSYCVVTSDSVSMISEATATGQPVFIEMLDEKRPAKKFQHFHKSMIEGSFAKPFDGSIEDWMYQPPDETTRVAERVQQELAKKWPNNKEKANA